MKCVELFHSYNYVNGKITIKDKNIYDSNNNLLLSLLNIPNISDLYNIKCQRILKKKKYSKKIVNNSYYTKHNIKIFLVINYKKLYYLISNKLEIPEFNILYKIILNNNCPVNNSSYLHDIMCINKRFNKKIINKKIKFDNNFNFFRLNDLFLDIINKKIIKKKSIISSSYIINGSIIFFDIFIKLIEEIRALKLNNCVYIGNKYHQSVYPKVIKNINAVNKNKVWDNIILLDTSIDIKGLTYNKIFVCINKLGNIKISEILDLYNRFLNINLYNYKLNIQLVSTITKFIYFKYYSYNLIKSNYIQIKNNDSINTNICITENNLINTICHICFTNNINMETKCNHYFCSDCIMKIIKKNNLICPHCREENNISDLNYLIKSKKNINNLDISNKFKYLLNKATKYDLIISNNDKILKYFKYLCKFLDKNITAYNSNKIIYFKQTTIIYFLEDEFSYNLNYISNNLMDCGIKKCVYNFFI